MTNLSRMEKEARETPIVISTQWIENISIIKKIAEQFRTNPPVFAVTIARGSSDHAASFLQYLLAKELGVVTASLPPSLSSIYSANLSLKNAWAIAISQSGASPDICTSLENAKKSGAFTIAMTNQVDSKLAKIADVILPFYANEEQAVAATKTYLASLAVIIQLIAYIKADKPLLKCLPLLPETLIEACDERWETLQEALIPAHNLIVIGRGVSYPIAQEAALKFKETCGLHAEPFSAAEFQHGPMALIQPDFPVLFFAQHDAALPGLLATCQKITDMGANTFLAVAHDDHIEKSIVKHRLNVPHSLHPLLDPLFIIQTFYCFIAQLSVKRGYNPDQPIHLKKVTETH